MFSMERVKQKSEWHLMKNFKFRYGWGCFSKKQIWCSITAPGWQEGWWVRHSVNTKSNVLLSSEIYFKKWWLINYRTVWWIFIYLPLVAFCRQESSDEGGEIDICLRFVKYVCFRKFCCTLKFENIDWIVGSIIHRFWKVKNREQTQILLTVISVEILWRIKCLKI